MNQSTNPPASPSVEEIAREIAREASAPPLDGSVVELVTPILTRWRSQVALAAKVEVLEEALRAVCHRCRCNYCYTQKVRPILAALRAEQEAAK